MSAQTTLDETSKFEQLLADLKIPSGVQHLADAVAQAGFEASTGTIASAGQHSSGDYSVGAAVATVLSGRSTRSGDSIWRTRGPAGGLNLVAV
jgi:hypothetical protein